MSGFMLMDNKYINSYEVSHVQVCHGKAGSELHMTSGKVLYSNKSPGQVMIEIADAREENEGK